MALLVQAQDTMTLRGNLEPVEPLRGIGVLLWLITVLGPQGVLFSAPDKLTLDRQRVPTRDPAHIE